MSAPIVASAGPFFVQGISPQPFLRGRWTGIVNRLDRSTSVPIADRSRPMIRSPPPRSGHGTMLHICRAVRDHHILADRRPHLGLRPGCRHAQRSADAQTAHQLALARTASLNVEVLVRNAGLIFADTLIGGNHVDGEHDEESTTDIQRGVQAASGADDSRAGLRRGRCLPRPEAWRDGGGWRKPMKRRRAAPASASHSPLSSNASASLRPRTNNCAAMSKS